MHRFNFFECYFRGACVCRPTLADRRADPLSFLDPFITWFRITRDVLHDTYAGILLTDTLCKVLRVPADDSALGRATAAAALQHTQLKRILFV